MTQLLLLSLLTTLTAACEVKWGKNVNGYDYRQIPARTNEECCALCRMDPDCKVAALYADKCWLKNRFPPEEIVSKEAHNLIIMNHDRMTDYLGMSMANKPQSSGCSCPRLVSFSPEENYGAIRSPSSGYSRGYCSNLHCTWAIKEGPPGTGIRLDFQEFKTEVKHDYVDILFISDQREYRLARHSGLLSQADLPRYTVTDGTLELSFVTDSSASSPGFSAVFQRFNISEEDCVCPKFLYDIGEFPETIQSPNYPDPYCHNMECSIFLFTTPPHAIKLQFQEFDLEPRYDSLSIFDGNETANEALIVRLSGSLKESQKEISSYWSAMTLQFRSDGDKSHKGFKAIATRIVTPCDCTTGNFTGSEGAILSPGFPRTYCGISCTYRIRVQPNYRIQLSINTLFLPASDSVRLYAGNQTHPLLWNFGRAPRSSFVLDGPEAKIELQSDGEHAGRPSQGFNFTFSQFRQKPRCSCPQPNPKMIEEKEGNISLRICAPVDCSFMIRRPTEGPDSEMLTLTFVQANLGYHSNVLIVTRSLDSWLQQEDYMPRRMGPVTMMPRHNFEQNIIYRYIGGRPSKHSESTEVDIDNLDLIRVFIHVEDMRHSSKLKVLINFRWHENLCKCPQEMVSLEAKVNDIQTLTSPNFPKSYCSDLACKWRIWAPEHHRVFVSIEDLRTEPGVDFLIIYDWPLLNRIPLLKLSGVHLYEGYRRHRPDDLHSVTSNGTDILIDFTTDGSYSLKGWTLKYHAVATDAAKRNESVLAVGGFYKPLIYVTGATFGWAFAAGLLGGLFLAILVAVGISFLRGGAPWRRWRKPYSISYARNSVGESSMNIQPEEEVST